MLDEWYFHERYLEFGVKKKGMRMIIIAIITYS
jgi:hypothetical protein